MSKPQELAYLIDLFHSLPGVGLKSAKKYAYFILKQDKQYIHNFVERIVNACDKLKLCQECGNLTNEVLCDICLDEYRDKSKVMIVTSFEDLERFEDSNCYNGLYHITFGEISNKKKINVNDLNILELRDRLQKHPEIKQIIIGLNKTYDGIVTGQYIRELLQDFNVDIYTIATGIPINACIDYADDETLKQAINNKKLI